MYKELIKKYISHLTIQHIKDYAQKENIILSEKEAEIINQFIHKNYLNLLEDNTTIIQLKNLLREDLYEKVYLLYQKNKTKYL